MCFLNHISFDGAKPASQSIQYLEAQMLPIVLKFSSFFFSSFSFFPLHLIIIYFILVLFLLVKKS